MAVLKYILSIFMAVVLTGCYEDFVPKVDIKPVLCVNSLITAGKPIDVDVSRTRLYTDECGADCKVADAVVSVYANGTLQGDDYIPQEGDNIRIVVVSDVYGRAEAEVTVPYAVPVKSLRFDPLLLDSWTIVNPDNPGATMAGGLSFNLSVEMEVEDPAATDNYYRLSMLGFNYGGEEDDDDAGSSGASDVNFSFGTFKYEAEPIFAEHIGVFESVMGNDSYGFTFFTDRQFSGKSYTLHLLFNNCSYSCSVYGSPNDEVFDCGMIFTLHTVSQSYYNWANYMWQRDEGIIGDIGDIGFGDPMWGYSNVSTGAGVVAAQAWQTYEVNLHDFVENELKGAYELNTNYK